MKKIFLILAMFSAALILSGAELSAEVVKVVDGDTLHLRLPNSKKNQRLRLNGIDAPETNQPFGKKSAQFLRNQVQGKKVIVRFDPARKFDRYKRMLGNIYIDGKNIELLMLKEGMAWHYSYYNKDPEYAAAERAARAAKKGLWSDPNPIEPYQFRKMKRQKSNKRKRK